MPLLDDVRRVCERLAPAGWHSLLLRHGLDIAAEDLAGELVRPLSAVDRSVPGFEDFAAEGLRGIEPGSPSRSLLFHALASPAVIEDGNGAPLTDYPTPAELTIVENAVFGLAAPTLPDLHRKAAGAFLAVAVFASEYRPAGATVHRRHADVCYSRTGVARVGTADARYDARARGFVTEHEDDPHAVRVLPARYAAYLAMQLPGSDGRFGPMNAELRRLHPELFGTDDDDARTFWVPIHKLFSGPDCIRGLDLDVTLRAQHVNEKIRRIHLELARRGETSHPTPRDLTAPPFTFTEGIADWATGDEWGDGLLAPIPHEGLVEPAEHRGQPLTFTVPASPGNTFAPSLFLPPEGGFRRAPEYVHVRTHVDGDGAHQDLNEDPEVAERVRVGGYEALHYIDHSGDGWVVADVPQLAVDVPRSVPAYSLVTAPDFYPYCNQGELMQWWVQRAPTAIRRGVWSTPPRSLSDERLAPNLQLPAVDFRPEDDTVTAIVSLAEEPGAAQPLLDHRVRRHTSLPDAAAGVFAPGWDTSHDETNGVPHLAAYGLGSPFAEDAKLCAALSAFWPAAAPDTARSFSRTFRTVSPLTDEEVGITSGDADPLPWDGVVGPRLVPRDGDVVVELASFDHVDYVEQAVKNRFTAHLTSAVTTEEYVRRVLACTRVYVAADLAGAADQWPIVSFRLADPEEEELVSAQDATQVALSGEVYRFELVERGREDPHPSDHRLVHLAVANRALAYVGALPVVLLQVGQRPWQAVTTP